MKRLSLILIAALMIGCGGAEDEDGVGEGASQARDKPPFEVEAKNGGAGAGVIITSLENGLRVLNVSINRGNCPVNWYGSGKIAENLRFTFKNNKDGSSVTVVDKASRDKEVEVLSVSDFYAKYGEDRAVEIDFGDKSTFGSPFCNPIESRIDTNKGSWTFTFR